MTPDRDLVSSHRLTRSRLSHTQRGNLWGKTAGAVGGGKASWDPKGYGSLTPRPPHLWAALTVYEGKEEEAVASGGRLGCRKTTRLHPTWDLSPGGYLSLDLQLRGLLQTPGYQFPLPYSYERQCSRVG